MASIVKTWNWFSCQHSLNCHKINILCETAALWKLALINICKTKPFLRRIVLKFHKKYIISIDRYNTSKASKSFSFVKSATVAFLDSQQSYCLELMAENNHQSWITPLYDGDTILSQSCPITPLYLHFKTVIYEAYLKVLWRQLNITGNLSTLRRLSIWVWWIIERNQFVRAIFVRPAKTFHIHVATYVSTYSYVHNFLHKISQCF